MPGWPVRHLFFQLDNCWRWNMNRYIMAYLECLFIWNVFEYIEVGFLQINHTHSVIYQTFSCTFRRLRTKNEITMEDMHEVFWNCYNEFTTVSWLKQVVNWSFLFEESGCLKKVDAISQYVLFKFGRKSELRKRKNTLFIALSGGFLTIHV